MARRRTIIILGAAALAMAALPVRAQTFTNYGCADGSRFIVAFYAYDTRAHLQIDGKPVTLGKRLALSGKRYTGSGITLRIMKDGAVSLRHARRPVTACSVT